MAEAEDAETLALMLCNRRSIHGCSDREAPTDLIETILDDARWAPN